MLRALVLVPLFCLALCAEGQGVPKAQALPPLRLPKVAEPTDPPPQNFEDRLTGVAFHLSPGWNLARTDGELSTFRLDARSAPARARLRGVAALAFNPFPSSTFSGALFYFSVLPQTAAEACAGQASAQAEPASTFSSGWGPSVQQRA